VSKVNGRVIRKGLFAALIDTQKLEQSPMENLFIQETAVKEPQHKGLSGSTNTNAVIKRGVIYVITQKHKDCYFFTAGESPLCLGALTPFAQTPRKPFNQPLGR
jgi:hypothetical protein